MADSKISDLSETEDPNPDAEAIIAYNGTNNSVKLKNILPDGTVTTSKLQRTIVLHVGNYYKSGTRYLASDTYAYDNTTDTYGPRLQEVLPWGAPDSPEKVFYYRITDTSITVVVSPFATCMAAFRYVLHNFGTDCNVGLIVHGHVSWMGNYDATGSTDYWGKEVLNFGDFNVVAIMSGMTPDKNVSNAHYYTWLNDRRSACRIDVDMASSNLGIWSWFRGPAVVIAGIHFVLRGSAVGSSMRLSGGTAAGGYHDVVSTRTTSENNQYLLAYEAIEGSIVYFSSGSGSPHEIKLGSAGGGFIKVAQNSEAVYANNGQNHLYIDGTTNDVNFLMCESSIGRNTFKFKGVSSEIRWRSGFTVDPHSSGSQNTHGCMIVNQSVGSFFQTRLDSGQFFGRDNFYITPVSTEGGYNDIDGGNNYTFIKHIDALPTTFANRTTYTNVASNSDTLYGRYNHSSGHKSTKVSLTAAAICESTSNFKARPESRVLYPYGGNQ